MKIRVYFYIVNDELLIGLAPNRSSHPEPLTPKEEREIADFEFDDNIRTKDMLAADSFITVKEIEIDA